MNQEQLDLVFSALSDPTRRGILERLADGETNVGTLAEPYDMSQPAISKHLRVLQRAGLIRRTRVGRQTRVRVDPRPIERAQTWISLYSRYWKTQFDAVDEYLEKRGKKFSQKDPTAGRKSGPKKKEKG